MPESGPFALQPNDVINVFNLENQCWRQFSASGDIPSASINCSGVICNGLFYLFGGTTQSNKISNEVHSFSPSSRAFKRLPVIGNRPSPRSCHEGWTHEGKLFFFGGLVKGKEKAAAKREVGSDYRENENGNWDGGECDNLLCQFDPQTNEWAVVETSGPIPSPRYSYAVAKLDNQVFILGGQGGAGKHGHGSVLGDFTMLDMRTSTWTKIEGIHPSWCGHSLSPISSTRLFLRGVDVPDEFDASGDEVQDFQRELEVGGHQNQKKVRIFNVKDEQWTEDLFVEPDWPHNYYPPRSRVVGVETENGISLFSFGGKNDESDDVLVYYDLE